MAGGGASSPPPACCAAYAPRRHRRRRPAAPVALGQSSPEPPRIRSGAPLRRRSAPDPLHRLPIASPPAEMPKARRRCRGSHRLPSASCAAPPRRAARLASAPLRHRPSPPSSRATPPSHRPRRRRTARLPWSERKGGGEEGKRKGNGRGRKATRPSSARKEWGCERVDRIDREIQKLQATANSLLRALCKVVRLTPVASDMEPEVSTSIRGPGVRLLYNLSPLMPDGD